ncbi:MAG TPA: hypothetical protein VN397_04560 [Candidatus Methylomirabilis sp.]|nr:hypothetical protein [Candidatus Methylomirabilis sp.]
MPHPLVETVTYGAAYVRLLLSHLTSKRGRDMPRLKTHTDHVVLIIPGFLGPRSVVRPLEWRFDRAGIPAFSFNLGLSSVLPIRAIVRLLRRRINWVRDRYPYVRRVDIVAHSMGGLIAIEAIRTGVFDGFEIRLVTLGSPFAGTWAALMAGVLPGAAEMLPLHPRFWRGPRNDAALPDIPFLSIAGDSDFLAPPERCRHPAAEYKRMPVDHAGLIFRKQVFQEALSFLARP